MHLRAARPTDKLKAFLPFYVDGLGLSKIGCFEGHDEFDGVMLGSLFSGYKTHSTDIPFNYCESKAALGIKYKMK